LVFSISGGKVSGAGSRRTGADAAGLRDHYFRAEETEIYAPIRVLDDREVQKALIAQPAARGGNLLVIEPPGPLAIPQMEDDVVPAAPDLLAYAELRYRGTGQAGGRRLAAPESAGRCHGLSRPFSLS
jgi:hypothetical protein